MKFLKDLRIIRLLVTGIIILSTLCFGNESRAQNNNRGSTKKIYFLSDHDEPSFTDDEERFGFSVVSFILKSNGYKVETLSLLEKGWVPKDASLVVFAGAKSDLKAGEVALLDKYISKGGAFLSMIDASVKVDNLNSLLYKYGFKYNNDLFVHPSEESKADSMGFIIIEDFNKDHPITSGITQSNHGYLLWYNVRSISEIEDSEYLRTILAKTNERLLVRVKDGESLKNLKSSKDYLDTRVFPVMGIATKKIENTENTESKDTPSFKESRVVVAGSSAFLTNVCLSQRTESVGFLMNLINYMTRYEEVTSIDDSKVTSVDIQSQEKKTHIPFLYVIFIAVVLGIVAVGWLSRL